MKIRTFLFLILTAFGVQSIHAETLRLSEPVERDEVSETFGASMPELPDSVELSNILQQPEAYLEKTFLVEAKVAKVCQKKGCFFIAHQGKDSVRVAFKDYGFFVPTDIAGREVSLIGELVAREVSSGQAEHFSKDLGEEGSVKSGTVYEIVASSVRVPTN